MSREVYIYPNHPEEFTWESYISEYPIHMSDISSERKKLKADIDNIKNKIFGLIGAIPRDVCNENDDPFEYVTDKMKSLIDDYKFIVGRLWKLFIIERYNESIEEGDKEKLWNTIDPDTKKPWKPYIWLAGISVSNEYQCESSIEENECTVNMLINKLMMYAASTPDRCFSDDDENGSSFDQTFFDVREILNDEDGIEYFWRQIFNLNFILDNFNEDFYNNYDY